MQMFLHMKHMRSFLNFTVHMRFSIILFFIITLAPSVAKAQFETFQDSVVQLYGVVMTADSLEGLPGASIIVQGQNRGTLTSADGVFSIVVMKGDWVEFSHVGFKSKLIEIPKNLTGNQYSIIQLMVNDTVYLPATILKPRITREQFDRDFVNTKFPDDNITIARQNNNEATRRALMAILPQDGREASQQFLRQQSRKMQYSGQVPPQNIFNPMAWAQFIEAWKRGDYKRKD